MERRTHFIKENWKKAGRWLLGVLIGLGLGKACDKVWPDSPTIVKEIADTVKVVHSIAPLPPETDSALTERIQQQLLNVEMLDKYDSYVARKRELLPVIPCKIITWNPYPNSKGYTQKNASSLCLITMTRDGSFLDFSYQFIRDDYTNLVNTLGVKVYRKDTSNERGVLVMDCNYEMQPGNGLVVRMVDNLAAGDYIIDAGFVLSADKLAVYPAFYSQSFSLKK